MSRPKGSKNKQKVLDPIGVSNIPKEVVQEAIKQVMENRNTVSGWVNVYRQVEDSVTNLFTGGDIHLSASDAKGIAQKNCIGQVYISLDYSKEN